LAIVERRANQGDASAHKSVVRAADGLVKLGAEAIAGLPVEDLRGEPGRRLPAIEGR
jgi:hypothetical protein